MAHKLLLSAINRNNDEYQKFVADCGAKADKLCNMSKKPQTRSVRHRIRLLSAELVEVSPQAKLYITIISIFFLRVWNSSNLSASSWTRANAVSDLFRRTKTLSFVLNATFLAPATKMLLLLCCTKRVGLNLTSRKLVAKCRTLYMRMMNFLVAMKPNQVKLKRKTIVVPVCLYVEK